VFYRVFGPYAVKHPLSKLRRAIIVGSGKEGLRILKKLRKRPDLPFEICGFVDFDEKNIGKEVDGTEVLASIENIRDVIRVENVSDVIFSSDRISNEQILETIANARQSGVSFRIVPHQLEYIVAKSAVEEIDSVPLIDFVGAYDPIDYMVKRLIDFILALLVVIVTLPLILINFLFGARITRRPFLSENNRERAVSRFTGGIPFLKNLPLFFSVLNGRISIVGSDLAEAETSGRRPFYKPGMTGLVQIKTRERKKPLNHDEKDYFNLYYLKNRSILTDLQILYNSLIR
jgi:lipopolysaccharide/colanic/teichoic acid biosynthesis glycosyltransferase